MKTNDYSKKKCVLFFLQYGPSGAGRGGPGFRGGRGGGRGGFNQVPGRGPGGYDGGSFQDQTTFAVPADKCGLVIGKGKCKQEVLWG